MRHCPVIIIVINNCVFVFIGVGAQSTLGGTTFLPENIYEKNEQNARILHGSCPKNYQNTRIFMIFARKLTKFPNFT